MVGNPSVVSRNPDISVPTGGGLEMAGSFCKAFQALVFIHLYGKPKGGNLQPTETAVLVKQSVWQCELVAAQAGVLRRGAVIIGCRRHINRITANGAARRCVGLRDHGCTGARQIGFRTAEWWRQNSGIFAAVDVAALRHPSANYNHLVNRGGRSIHGSIRVSKFILRRQCRSRHHRRDGQQQHHCFQPVPHMSSAPFFS